MGGRTKFDWLAKEKVRDFYRWATRIVRYMTAKKLCIFCEEILGPHTKPEHILLNALGGRKTTRSVICSKHNNDFGGSIDDALADQVNVVRNLLQLESGTGKPPPALKNLQAGSERVNIDQQGKPALVKPPFTVNELPDGKMQVELHLKSPEEMAKVLPHLAGKLGMPLEHLAEQMKNAQAAFVERRPGRIHHAISLGGPTALRSVAKSCLVLFATVAGNDAVKAPAFQAARDYVLNGCDAFNKDRVQIDSRDVPGLENLKRRFGPFFNLIYVRSNDIGRVIGHFTMYNVISWQMVLAEAGGPPNTVAALASNPLDPKTWGEAESIADIPFDWLNAADRSYELEHARQRFNAVVAHHVKVSQEGEVSRMCDDVFAKLGVTHDNQPISGMDAKRAVGEIAQRLAAHALGLPHEKKLTPEEIEALLQVDATKAPNGET